MFEFSIACKYLIPRWRQLSVSIISLISVLVISLVVWLIIVFFSVVHGLEKVWTDKLIGLTAPVRIIPTDAYYQSYYYLIDSISSSSNYTAKSLAEKIASPETDPYQPGIDEEIPANWPAPLLDADGKLIDLAKEMERQINALVDVPGISAKDYEVTFGNVHLKLIREPLAAKTNSGEEIQPAGLSQAAYLASFDGTNPWFQKTLTKIVPKDLQNLLNAIARNMAGNKEQLRIELGELLDNAKVTALQTPEIGWRIPQKLLPAKVKWEVILATNRAGQLSHLIVPPAANLAQLTRLSGAEHLKTGVLQIEGNSWKLISDSDKEQKDVQNIPLVVPGQVTIPAELVQSSLARLNKLQDLQFEVHFQLQGVVLEGRVPFRQLEIAEAQPKRELTGTKPPFWIGYEETSQTYEIPLHEQWGEGVILPKSYREAGVLLGDQGYLSYYIPTASSMQEQRIPIFVAGFYDHGVLPIGGKMVLLNKETISLIRSSYEQNDGASSGINVRFDNIEQAGQVKNQLQHALAQKGLDRYWKIETYREYDFAKDLLQQISSEKNLFSLISIVIIIVACSNIISMLIIMVNDKKLEIGILRSMGAHSGSIAFIFGFCGITMGLTGSLLGIGMAVATLHYLQPIVDFIGRVQGYEMFNAMIYGETLPNQLSLSALAMVLAATVAISLIAGLVPAIKACLLKPSAILRAE